MKINRKFLSIFVALGMFSLVGCDNQNISDTSEEFRNDVAINKEVENGEEIKEGITEEEAIKMVENEIKDVAPELKLKVRDANLVDNDNVYILDYDTPFVSEVSFCVYKSDGEMSVIYDDIDEYDISKYKSAIEELKSQTPISMEKARDTYVRIERNKLNGTLAGLSDNQLDNLELANDYMIKTPWNYVWVFRYPMEKKQEWVTEGLATMDNATDINDKYGYLYIDPYSKEYNGYIQSWEWGEMDYWLKN